MKFDPPDDGLASEHAIVTKWVEDATASLGQGASYETIELKSLPSGAALVEGSPQETKRIMLAALTQTRFWDAVCDRIRAGAKTDTERLNPHMFPEWESVWPRRRQAEFVVSSLMRRALPLAADDLIALIDWCLSLPHLTTYYAPVGHIARALERFAKEHTVEVRLVDRMRAFAAALRATYDGDAKRYGTSVEQLCGPAVADATPASAEHRPRPSPAPAGHPLVLQALKEGVGALAGEMPPTQIIGADQCPLPMGSPLRSEHELLSELFARFVGTQHYSRPPIENSPVSKMDAVARGRVLLAAAERSANALMQGDGDLAAHAVWQSRYSAAGVIEPLIDSEPAFDRAGRFDFLLYLAMRPNLALQQSDCVAPLLAEAEADAHASDLTEGERFVLHLLRAALIGGPPLGNPGENIVRLTRLIGDGAQFILAPGEFWADAVNEQLAHAANRRAWTELIAHFLTATSSRPSLKWLKTATQLIDALGRDGVFQTILDWLPAVAKGRSIPRLAMYPGDTRSTADTMHEENALALRGMLWVSPLMDDKAAAARAIAAVALSAYKKVPGVGPRAVKVGNACIYALSELATREAVGQLAMLKVRVKFGTAQKEIEKAFNAAAEALGLPRDEIEELGVPTYGLEEVGVRREQFGDDFRAELCITGREVALSWSRGDGKPLKSVPAKVKADFKDDLKELQQAAKDIAAMLPAQSERLDSMFLLQKRWPLAQWRERYLDHPLVGTLARRLIWNFRDGEREQAGMWLNGQLVDVNDAALSLSDSATAELWHPIGGATEEILAWRGWLERHQVQQPFKQAHREIYPLTEAERRTATYSNRFAAHILRQHQFNALCAARGWKNNLRLLVDDEYPPASRVLPNWGLRAEFWIEGVGQDYGQDTNESGVFLRLSTDQVRFYRADAAQAYAHAGGGAYTTRAFGPGVGNANEPLGLTEIPPLVFSEIMRDVDLFVGVASIGNDPTWNDGGPGGHFRGYWDSYSWGELSGSAVTRRQVLESLLPRLTKLRDRWRLADRFLIIRGEIRSYKIHLGSGNILMEPSDTYLCIVPDRSTTGRSAGDVFLPFEGDAMLSVILSKAFLLAEDKKIKDPTITRQIGSVK